MFLHYLMCSMVCLVIAESRKAVTGCFKAHIKDICNGAIPDIPDMYSREAATMITNETSHWRYCDVFAIKKHHWYKSFSNMTTSCPSIFMCGTKFPIWMTGTIPEPHEGIVSRTSCLKTFDSCCLLNYTLTVVNCEVYMAYCLIDLPSGCHQRYCFDKGTERSTFDARVSSAPSTTAWSTQRGFVSEGKSSASKQEQETISGADNETYVHGNSNVSEKASAGCFGSSVNDICNGVLPDFPTSSSRDATLTSKWIYCDEYAIKEQHWYKALSNMATSCPSNSMCGTMFPIWMKGINPEPDEGIVNRTSCMKFFQSCCVRTYKLAVVNCEDYMAYCLIDLPSSCQQNYCFDKEEVRSTSEVRSSRASSSLSRLRPLNGVPNQKSTATQQQEEIILGIDNSTSVHANEKETHLFARTVPSNVLTVCTGLMATVIIVLIILIVFRRLLKVSEATAMNTKSILETFSKPDILTITTPVDKEEKLQD